MWLTEVIARHGDTSRGRTQLTANAPVERRPIYVEHVIEWTVPVYVFRRIAPELARVCRRGTFSEVGSGKEMEIARISAASVIGRPRFQGGKRAH